MKLISFFLLMFCCSAQAAGQATDAEAPKPKSDESAATAEAINDESVSRRQAGSAQLLLNYSGVDLLIPGKYGATATWIDGPGSSLELEYLTGSLKFPFLIDELGSMRDSRFTLLRRNYAENGNFNFFYGLSYQKFHVKVGNEILSRMARLPYLDIMNIDTIGAVIGVGHRWVFDNNITLGIDWISLTQGIIRARKKAPILDHVQNASDRRALDKVVSFAGFFPRIVLLKLQVGLTF